VTRFVAAARYLTIVPIPSRFAAHEAPGPAAAWFPVVGLLIGGVLVGVDRLAALAFAPLLAAALVVAVWKLVTGALHLDGLADCVDGLAGRDPARRLEIMRDSRIGTFGTTAVVLAVVLAVAGVAGIDARARGGALILAPVAGRAMAPIVGRLFASAAAGHGASFRAGLGGAAPIVAAIVALVVAVAALGATGLAALLVAGAVGLAWAAFMARRLGGITGDVHGAVIELAELAALLTVAARHPA
jgi:adenosylcobinamide-GDP ribazoletransferase